MKEKKVLRGLSLSALGTRQFWLGFFAYSLFFFSVVAPTGREISIALLLLLAAYHRWRAPVVEQLPWWVIAPFFAWWGATIISALVNPDRLANLSLLTGQFRTVLPFALIPALFQVDLRRFLRAYLFVVSLFAAYGIAQFFWGIDWSPWLTDSPLAKGASIPGWGRTYRPRGFFGNVNAWGYLLRNTAPLFFALWFFDRGKTRFWWGMGAGLGVLGTILSLSRGAWAGLVAATIVLGFMFPRRWAYSFAVITVAGFFAVAWVAISGTLLRSDFGKIHNPIFQRVAGTTAQNISVGRLFLWASAVEGIKDNPWFGVGVGYPEKLVPYRNRVLQLKTGPDKQRWMAVNRGLTPRAASHNLYLQVLFLVGVVGLVPNLALFASVLAWNFHWIKKGGRDFPVEKALLWGSAASLVGTLFHGIFEDAFFSAAFQPMIMMLFGLSLFAGIKIRRGLTQQEPATPENRRGTTSPVGGGG